MEKNMNITAEACYEIMNKQNASDNSFEWNGYTVKYKNALSFKEMKWIVDTVVDACYNENGEYTPWMKDGVERICVVSMYSDIVMPENPEDAYDFVYGTDIYDELEKHIANVQLYDIKFAIDCNIDNINAANTKAINAGIEKIMSAINAMSESFGTLFDGVSQEDIQNVMSAIGDGKIDEEKLMKAYASLVNKE